MDFLAGTFIIQLLGLAYFVGILVVIVLIIAAIFQIKSNTKRMADRLESIERLLGEYVTKKE
ncbi:hypothetical protein [Tumebacillus lipolyticus]|uniref:DUF4083 domain-containing protein n=1 Tax=Tumebacillus lipolyticus TaxID=1280370 RepID=A0ABW4ZUS4_9BACL